MGDAFFTADAHFGASRTPNPSVRLRGRDGRSSPELRVSRVCQTNQPQLGKNGMNSGMTLSLTKSVTARRSSMGDMSRAKC